MYTNLSTGHIIHIVKAGCFTENLCYYLASMLTVKGKIVFSGGAPESIPNNSTLTVKFQDTNRMDAPAINLGTCVKSIQDYKKGTDLFFEILKAKKPDYGMDGSVCS